AFHLRRRIRDRRRADLAGGGGEKRRELGGEIRGREVLERDDAERRLILKLEIDLVDQTPQILQRVLAGRRDQERLPPVERHHRGRRKARKLAAAREKGLQFGGDIFRGAVVQV